MEPILLRLPRGGTRVLSAGGPWDVAALLAAVEDATALPARAFRLVSGGIELHARCGGERASAALRKGGGVVDVRLGLQGGGGDQARTQKDQNPSHPTPSTRTAVLPLVMPAV